MIADAGNAEKCQTAVYTILEKAIARHGDRTAVWASGQSLNYAGLGKRVKVLAERIAASVPRDSVVSILLPSGIDFVVGIVACLAARRTFVVLDVDAPELNLPRIC